MKILIVGSGWLGNRLKDYFGDRAILHKDKIGNDFVTSEEYDVLINTAAKTDIDWCEKNKLETLRVNAILAANLARMCKEKNKKYIFFSSACIFESQDWDENFLDIKYEDSEPNPKCFYSLSKYVAEQLILEANPEAIILRPRLPISGIPHPRNTLDKLLKYEFINDAQESMTVMEDMFSMLNFILEQDLRGIFHVVNEGTISPHELADLMKHPHAVVSKKEQDERLKKEGRAKRVTTYIGSKRIKLLPNIRERINDIIIQHGNSN